MPHPVVADMLGRPDLNPYNMSPSTDMMGQGQPLGFEAPLSIEASASGRLSAGILALGVLALVVFYVWTRGYQL